MSVPWGGTLRAKGDDLGPTLLLPGTPPVLPGVAAEMGKSIQCHILLLVQWCPDFAHLVRHRQKVL